MQEHGTWRRVSSASRMLMVSGVLFGAAAGCTPIHGENYDVLKLEPSMLEVCVGQAATFTWTWTSDGKAPEMALEFTAKQEDLSNPDQPEIGTEVGQTRDGNRGTITLRCDTFGSTNIKLEAAETSKGIYVATARFSCRPCQDAGTPPDASAMDASSPEDASTTMDASTTEEDASMAVDAGDDEPDSVLTQLVVLDQTLTGAILANRKANPAPEACTDLSDDSECEVPEDSQHIEEVLDPILDISEAAATRLFTDTLSCGDHGDYRVLCGPETPAAGQWVYLFTRFGADVPLAGSRYLQYAFVFEADGDDGNGWEPLPAYPKDFFAGTDLWYEALYTPGSGWTMQVRDARQDLAAHASAARMIIAGAEFGILVPLADFDTASPAFRTTAFAHTGDYGSSGPWSGDYVPVLDEPLLPVATDVVIALDE